MPNYRRSREGSRFFFTLVTEGRARILLSEIARSALRRAFRETRERWPFAVEGIVLLEDHLHVVWALPEGDVGYPKRWGFIKKRFTQMYLEAGGRERGVWQRRYWEHTLRDEDDYRAHMDYLHYNPVKHGLAECPKAWEYSSFHRCVGRGLYEEDWGCLQNGRLEFPGIWLGEWE